MPAVGNLRALPAVAALMLCVCCSQEQQRFVTNAGADTPTMSTADVSTLISDSGYTRYHLTAPLWLMFEDAEEPFWRFPDGLELEQYDLKMQPESNVVCDSATYFSRLRLWRLDGNVVMVNTQRDSFLTQQLFWDQTKRKIYSDSFIHIVRTDRTIEGYGFESDQSMLYYTVNRPTAILPARRPGAKEAAKPDSLPGKTPPRPASTPRPQAAAAPAHIHSETLMSAPAVKTTPDTAARTLQPRRLRPAGK
ncbi:MAG: LPS export ABC transporter periplasmic protein LptC [Muribaculaceae bacterium]|nr:LPS export ABC transporter periplasmic protein LptC [Muribaculaceae bacterium]MDE6134215.1 LPS export ABC transporter periplasmic protein LptC [Muribaculaceae bacterium]